VLNVSTEWTGNRAFQDPFGRTRNQGDFRVIATSGGNIATTGKPADGAHPVNPYRNPSYPERTHFAERDELAAVLRSCEERLSSARVKLESLANDAQRQVFARLYHQLQGARDQVAEMARRIPLETGELYREDKERVTQAIAAFERTWNRWNSAAG
jgi:hypothetical protein